MVAALLIKFVGLFVVFSVTINVRIESAVAFLLFPTDIDDIFIFTVLGSFFFESTTGFSVIIKGTFTAGQSLKKNAQYAVFVFTIVPLSDNTVTLVSYLKIALKRRP